MGETVNQGAGQRAGRDDALLGIGLYVLGVFLLSVMDVGIKLLTERFSVPEIVFFRNLFGLVPLLIYVGARRRWSSLRSRNLKGQILRGVVAAGAALTFFYAFSVMALADAYAIAFASPLFMTALTVPLLGESVGWRRWAAVLVGFAGVLIMVRPGGGDALVSIGAAAALAGTFLFALSMVLVRRLVRGDSSVSVTFHSAIVSMVVMLPLLAFDFVLPDPSDLLMMLAVGLLGGIGGIVIVEAFRQAPPPVLAPFEYSAMIWAVVFGWLIWRDLPDQWIVVGGTVVVASGIYIVHREARARRVPSPVSASGATVRVPPERDPMEGEDP